MQAVYTQREGLFYAMCYQIWTRFFLIRASEVISVTSHLHAWYIYDTNLLMSV